MAKKRQTTVGTIWHVSIDFKLNFSMFLQNNVCNDVNYPWTDITFVYVTDINTHTVEKLNQDLNLNTFPRHTLQLITWHLTEDSWVIINNSTPEDSHASVFDDAILVHLLSNAMNHEHDVCGLRGFIVERGLLHIAAVQSSAAAGGWGQGPHTR